MRFTKCNTDQRSLWESWRNFLIVDKTKISNSVANSFTITNLSLFAEFLCKKDHLVVF